MPSSKRHRSPRLSRRDRLIAATSGAVLAATAAASAQPRAEALPEITVSAHQTPLPTDRSGASVTVISGEELREKNLQTVADALRAVPGVEVDSSGGRGNVTAVRIRGGESRHVLVVIDGIEVNQLGFPGFDFADLQTDDIERLEVLRGPQSGLYGATAQSGVISITTRSGKGLAKPQANLRVESGSFDTNTGAAAVRGAFGPMYGSFSVSHYNTRGYNIARSGSEPDGSRALTLNGKAGIDLTPDLNIDSVFRYTARNADTDGTDFATGLLVDRSTTNRYTSDAGRVGATFRALDGRWIHNANVKLFQEHSRSFSPTGVATSGADGRRINTDYKSTMFGDTNLFGGEKHTAILFVDRRTESYRQITNGAIFDKERNSLGGEYILDLAAGTTLSGALRQDWNSAFDDVLTYRLALSQRLPVPGMRLHASTGSGVTDPNVFELFGFAPFLIGNPNLTPESSVGYDVGVEQRFWNGRALVDVTYFSINLKNEIVGVPVAGGTLSVNGPNASRRQGVEVSSTVDWLSWLSTTASYTYTDSTDPFGLREIRRPPHSGSFEATTRLFDGRTRASARVAYNGIRDDSFFGPAGATRVILPSTTIVRASLSHDVTPWATAYVRAENLFNTRYEEVFTFRAPGFAVYGGLKLRTIE